VTCTMGRLRAMKAILAAKIEFFIDSLLAAWPDCFGQTGRDSDFKPPRHRS
jgi:hypothetical protein